MDTVFHKVPLPQHAILVPGEPTPVSALWLGRAGMRSSVNQVAVDIGVREKEEILGAGRAVP